MMKKKSTLVLLVSTLLFVSVQLTFGAGGYKPVGSIEDLYKLETLPCLRPGVTCKMFSSYDRTGGNDDGFSGKYSMLRAEDGNAVVAEMEGAGCIHRIWMPYGRNGNVMGDQQEHIKVYLDGSETPAIDVPLEDIYAGKLPQFPKPLVGKTLGGFYCYVPIPYRSGCKVILEGTDVRFYQVTYSEFESAEGVKTFSMDYDAATKQHLAKAIEVWNNPEKLTEGTRDKDVKIKLKAGKKKKIRLPRGGAMVRGIYFDLEEGAISDNGLGRIRIFWDKAETPAVDMPLSYFFGQVFKPEPYQSLFVGKNQQGYYNFMPMAYGKKAKIELIADKDLTGTLKVMTQSCDFDASSMAYFHGLYHEAELVDGDGSYPWLKTQGKGNYLGTYLVTEGPKYHNWLPVWLEGDERFLVNDELWIHGTGSEDYFNCGYYAMKGRLNQPGARTLHGFPIYETNPQTTMQAVAYRWHLADVVPYDGTIDASIEHGAVNDCAVDYSSGVYFYDTRPGAIALDK